MLFYIVRYCYFLIYFAKLDTSMHHLLLYAQFSCCDTFLPHVEADETSMDKDWQGDVEYLGIVGGSSFLKSAYFSSSLFQKEVRLTRYGPVAIHINRVERVVFVQRHAANPDVAYSPPHLINKKGIISALRALNCKRVIGFNSTGSMKRTIDLGTLVVPNDFISLRPITFFDDARAHVIPGFCEEFREQVITTLRAANLSPVVQAVYVQTDGPRFETEAEIRFFAREADIVGMTAAHEAILCQEAGLQYATVCMVDNWANGVNTRQLKTEEFHSGVANNLKVMENVLDTLLKKFRPVVPTQEELTERKESSRRRVDEIIHARWIVPVAPDNENDVLEAHSLVIHDGKILDILPTEKANALYVSDMVDDLSHSHALHPGLINAHTHVGMTLLRGYSDDKALLDWLQQDIWPAEHKFMSDEFVRAGAQLAVAEMIRSGTTCFNDMYFHPGATAKVVDETGIRAVLGFPILDVPDASAMDRQAKEGLDAINQYKGHPRIAFAISPHAPYTVCDDNLVKCKKFAEEQGVIIHTHLHEQECEVIDSIAGNKSSSSCHKSDTLMAPLENFDRLGLVDDKLVAVHMTKLSDEHIQLLAKRKAHVVHCPNSNLKLASGFARIADLLKAGVNVGLGTDSTASNNALDMYAEIKLAAVLAKAVSKNSTSLPASQALRLATYNNAKLLGLEKQIGSLERGKLADIVAVKINGIEHIPIYSVYSHLVYSTTRDKVSDVWIGGRRVLRHYALLTVNKHEIMEESRRWQEKIAAARPTETNSE